MVTVEVKEGERRAYSSLSVAMYAFGGIPSGGRDVRSFDIRLGGTFCFM
jgi:hypothetical protein